MTNCFFVTVKAKLSKETKLKAPNSFFVDASLLGFKRLIPIKARALECWVLEPNVKSKLHSFFRSARIELAI